MKILSRSAAVGCFALLAAFAGCNADTNNGSTDAAIPRGDGGRKGDLGFVDGGPSTDLACVPEVTSCTGLCGPVHDGCTGQDFQCGACAMGLVCDLDQHVCVTPKDTCADLGRVCGSTKNSCGTTITCSPFYCTGKDADGNAEECDPNTNQCVTCDKTITCGDLGYECGPAWLGCGDGGDPANYVNCGSCAANANCNAALHICEPANGGTCGGATEAAVCAAAALSDGVQCGAISNGCGGIIPSCESVDPVHFGCPIGMPCGGAGIPNQCGAAEPPTECITSGFNCGVVPDACDPTHKNVVTCGPSCPGSNMVCLNNVCSVECNMPMKSCTKDYAGMCGKQLDNNCWPKLDCDSNCVVGSVCSTDSTPGTPGTCSVPKMCGEFGANGAAGDPCSTGPSSAFPIGDGTDATCPCSNIGPNQGQEVCNQIGSNGEGKCCQRPSCTGNEATVPGGDPCNNGAVINCCSGSQVPYMGVCCAPTHNCEDSTNKGNYTKGTDNCGLPYTCPCSRYGTDDPTAGPGNACCAKPACAGGQCTGSVTSSCSGKTTQCGVGNCTNVNGEITECDPTTKMCCNEPPPCKTNVYQSGQTDACHNAYSCSCAPGELIPKDASGNPVQGATCCDPPSCNNDCSGDVAVANCHGQAGVSNAMTGSITCNSCTNGNCCAGGKCQPKATCVSGTCATIPDGCGTGGTVPCQCLAGDVCSNGMCSCPSVVCQNCTQPTQTNACGSTNPNCGCSNGEVCGSDGKTCCLPTTTCAAGLPKGDTCGQFTDPCTGTKYPCPCSAVVPNQPAAVCSDPNAGTCVCTPEKCCKDTGGVTPCLSPGPYSNDGCGNAGTCAS